MERGFKTCDQIKINVYLNAGLGAEDPNLNPQCLSSFGETTNFLAFVNPSQQ